MSVIRKEQLTNPLSASYALTASYAENAPPTSVNTGSLLTTASVNLNTITFTKGNGSTFPITVNTGSGGNIDISGLVTTSSFNAFTSSINTFTSSYNTGSFSGSFTGSFNGTASWARNALTASYVSSSNVYGPNGFDSVNYATSAGSAGTATTATTADGITSPLSQNLTINGSFDVNTSFGILDTLLDNAFNSGIGYGYSGEILVVDLGRPGFDVAAGISPGNLLSLDSDGIWRLTNNVNASASYMLGFYVRDPNTSDYGILIDGYMVLSGSIDNPKFGRSLFITGSGPVTYTTNPTSITSGYIRNIGHLHYTNNSTYPDYWVLKFKPSNDWTEII
jgi:hypothetical protein